MLANTTTVLHLRRVTLHKFDSHPELLEGCDGAAKSAPFDRFRLLRLGKYGCSTKNRALTISIFIFILALIVRLLFIITLGADERIYDSLHDQYIYIDLAKNIVEGRGLSLSFDIFVADANTPTSIQPPVYPMILSLLFFLFGESYLAVRLLQVVLGAGVCVVTFLTARKVLGEPVGLLAALIVCVYPPLVMYTRPIMTETLYSFLVSLIVLFLVYFALGTFRHIHFIIWWTLFGLTFLLRPEILVFALAVVAFAFWWTLTQRQNALRSVSLGIGLASLMFIVTVGPWVVRNWRVQGEPTVFPNKRWSMWEENWLRYMLETSSGWEECKKGLKYCDAMPNFNESSELERDRYLSRVAKEFIVSHPGVFVRYGVSRCWVGKQYPIARRFHGATSNSMRRFSNLWPSSANMRPTWMHVSVVNTS
jgi:4-amino-4-deoxy-L-arabinose transferase-like glycosyltransferase